MRTRIKICGMTEPDKVKAAVGMGVDAIGMILHADSPRVISVEAAKEIRSEVPAFVSLVGVFVDCDALRINQLSQSIGLDLVQLHGSESNEFSQELDTPFIKAIRARDETQVLAELNSYPSARALLLDPYVKGQHGGTGKRLDTQCWPQNSEQNLILAGGLSADNVASLITELKPFAVDFNSGVEDSPGVKNLDLLAAAINAVTSS